jgi:hypothetical protein
LELLVRGVLTDTPTLVSQKFSMGFYRMIAEKGCIEEDAPKSNVGKTFALGLLKKFGGSNPQAVQVD